MEIKSASMLNNKNGLDNKQFYLNCGYGRNNRPLNMSRVHGELDEAVV